MKALRTARGVLALAAATLALAACGPESAAAFDAGSANDSLAASADELEFTAPAQRAQDYEQLLDASRAQASAQLFDRLAVFAVQSGDGHLVAAPLPPARELLGTADAQVDLDRSPDPWPVEARPGLGSQSERELAGRAGAVLAQRLGIAGPVIVERAAGAPYAAALVEGRLRLNPALLYLAVPAAREAGGLGAAESPAYRGERGPGEAVTCATVPAAALAWPLVVVSLLPVLRRRAH